MASSGKPKTTMAKLKREAALRERRMEKAVRKQIRKQAQLAPDQPVAPEFETQDGVTDASHLDAGVSSQPPAEPRADEASPRAPGNAGVRD